MIIISCVFFSSLCLQVLLRHIYILTVETLKDTSGIINAMYVAGLHFK